MPLSRPAPRHRLQIRIVGLFLGLLLVVQTASLLLIGNSIGVNARAAVDAELRTGERVFARLLEQNASDLTAAARLMAADYGFREAVASRDAATLASALANHGQRIGTTVALITDEHFKLAASTGEGAARLLPALQGLASSAQRGTQVVLQDGEPYQLVAVPVKAPLVIGWVGMAFRIESKLLIEMRELSSVEMTIIGRRGEPQRWALLQSTLADGAGEPLLATWLRAHEATGARAGAIAARNLLLDLHEAGPMTGRVLAREVELGSEGEGQAIALLMRSLDDATAPYRRLQWTLLGFTLVAVAVFAVGSVFTARRITTPLRELARSAARLGRGDYDQSFEIDAKDEIGQLARAFEAMRKAVQARDAEVRRLAYEDPLTKLPNREKFRAVLRQAITHARAEVEPCAIIMLDLDRLKHINDMLGHRFGDRVLRRVARRLKEEAQRSQDVVARLGGDEFALLLPGADVDIAQAVARRIQQSFEAPITLDGQTVDLGAGMGLACCPDHGIDADALMSHAEKAMYTAKRNQTGIVVYTDALDTGSEESLSLLSELRTAVDGGELRLYLQPKISLASGAVVGAEALVRWEHPQRGMLPPMRFIPFAERTGFIRMLTSWMIERCARVLQQLNTGGVPLKLSVNLSTRDLLDPELAPKLQRLIDVEGINPSLLCLEITESAIMDDPVRALQTLERLHQMGFKLAIDDFGTGYSSLAYLKRLPVDELKIDQSFVLNMERDLDDAKIVRSTVDLAHNLGLLVVAEGVETAKAWKLLQALGCDEAQGYFVAKPMPEALFANWVSEWRAPQVQSVRLDPGFSRLTV